ncbi:hypothetical protein EIN_380450 [Entamoeba invadens IP1]|uniref:Uncharacterized protein n=1 Tax=Entamoeba invadens IP1 TaxID=370355 RepID=A0A0A1UAL9_ENTIV|nr:hypothetical protein EIN_380450 [Entamoeba invadens IP1]ELP92118.1 hypothetical protein EIN_380450 [Entamoeba invadens IP1]|eukprot:XP_004258889.1 hypothetical protein EIN_380450 [Entamoeba invadens IP1]
MDRNNTIQYMGSPVHINFISTVTELGLANNESNTEVLSFLNEDGQIEIISLVLHSLSTSKNLPNIEDREQLMWIVSTLSKTFVSDKTAGMISLIVALYGRWLRDENELNRPRYITNNYKEAATVLLGQMTLAFSTFKTVKSEIQTHVECCASVVNLLFDLIVTKRGSEMNDWITTCVFGMFESFFKFFHKGENASERRDNPMYIDYIHLMKRLINLLHYCILRGASTASMYWNIFIQNASTWFNESEFVSQWGASLLALQEAYMNHILNPSSASPHINFLCNTGKIILFDMEESVTQDMWLSFIKLSNVEYSIIEPYNAFLIQEAISMAMHDLLSYEEIDKKLPPPDGNVILDLFGDNCTLPIFHLDSRFYLDAMVTSVGNICSFFGETLKTTTYEEKYLQLLIHVIRTVLSSNEMLLVKMCIDTIENVLEHPISNLLEILPLLYSSILQFFVYAESDKEVAQLLNASTYNTFIKVLNASLVHFNKYLLLQNEGKVDEYDEILLCTLLRKLVKTELCSTHNFNLLCDLLTSVFITFIPQVKKIENIKLDYHDNVTESVFHLAWGVLFDVTLFVEKSSDFKFQQLQSIFTVFLTIAPTAKAIPKNGPTFTEAVVQLVFFVFAYFEGQKSVKEIPEVLVNLLIRVIMEYLILDNTLQNRYIGLLLDILAKISPLFPSLSLEFQLLLEHFIQFEMPKTWELFQDGILIEQKLLEKQKNPIEHISMFMKNNDLYSLVDVPLENQNTQTYIIKRTSCGCHMCKCALNTQQSTQTNRSVTVTPNKNMQILRMTNPLFCCDKSETSTKEEEIKLLTFVINNRNNKSSGIDPFSTTLGAQLIHSNIIGISSDDVCLNVCEELFQQIRMLDETKSYFTHTVLIDYPQDIPLTEYFVTFLNQISKTQTFSRQSQTTQMEEQRKFISIDTTDGNFICECPAAFKTAQKESYDIQIIVNVTERYSPKLIAKTVLVLCPISTFTLKITSMIDSKIVSTLFINKKSLSLHFPQIVFRLFVHNFNTLLNNNRKRQEIIDTITKTFSYKNGRTGLFLFNNVTQKNLEKAQTINFSSVTEHPPISPVDTPQSFKVKNGMVLPQTIDKQILDLKSHPTPEIPLFHLTQNDLKQEQEEHARLKNTIRSQDTTLPRFYP